MQQCNRLAALALITLFSQTACVRRTMTIQTEPAGALVYLNDEELGRSPVTTDFLWYGDYGITLRKEGHATLKTNEHIKAPWYQTPGIDFWAEVLWPGQFHDQRSFLFELDPEEFPNREELIDRAGELRERSTAASE